MLATSSNFPSSQPHLFEYNVRLRPSGTSNRIRSGTRRSSGHAYDNLTPRLTEALATSAREVW